MNTRLITKLIGQMMAWLYGGMIPLVVIAKAFRLQVRRSIYPKHMQSLALQGKPLEKEFVSECFAYLGLMVAALGGGVIFMALAEPALSRGAVFSSVVSSLCNAGVAFNEMGFAGNYGFLDISTKCMHSLLMLRGRLGFFALLALFSPSL